jgi:hypothetical protein
LDKTSWGKENKLLVIGATAKEATTQWKFKVNNTDW